MSLWKSLLVGRAALLISDESQFDEALTMHIPCRNCGDIFLADKDWKTYCIPCYIKMKKAQEGFASKSTELKKDPILTEDMLNRIIRLCHPDKHKSSEASHIATVFLLNMRDEMRGSK